MPALLLAAAMIAAAPAPAAVAPQLINLREVFTADDYPAEAINANLEGAVDMRLSIDAKGRLTGCTIANSSGSAILDSASCRLIAARGKFTPARDRRKRAIAGQLTKRVTWRMPPQPVDEEPQYYRIRMTYPLKDGVPVGPCRAEISPSDGTPSTLCEEARGSAVDLSRSIPAAARGSAKELVLLVERQPDTLAGPAPLAGIPGLVVIDDRFARLTVDASGKVTHCVAGGATMASGGGGAAAFCARFEATRYAAEAAGASSAPRKILFRSQAYARK